MRAEELRKIFLVYLGREPLKKEYETHGQKDVNRFTEEIQKCDEFKKLGGQVKYTDKRIAFVLSGHIRYNNVLAGILRYSNQYDIDIFIHTWDTVGIKGNEMNLDIQGEYDRVVAEIEKFPNVRAYQIENNKDYIDSIKGEDKDVHYFNYSSPEKFIKSQLYSINRSFKLLEEYKKNTKSRYDLVVKLRFDLHLADMTISPSNIIDCANNKILFFPNRDCKHPHPDHGTSCWACDKMYYDHGFLDVHVFEHTNVVCDIMAYGSFESMKKYCSLYDSYDELNKQNFEINHKMMKKRKNNYVKKEGKDYKIQQLNDETHVESLYFYYCSYPERLLMQHLRDYMLVESIYIKVEFIR